MTHVIANWKDYLTPQESIKLFDRLCAWEKKHPWPAAVQVSVAPSALALGMLLEKNKRTTTRVKCIMQDIGFARGAYTGAVSAHDAHACGVATTLIGHSERRQWFGEDDALVLKKIIDALTSHMRVVLCVGETKDERQSGRASAVVRRQLEGVMKNSEIAPHMHKITIAYEPRWAIGTGIPIEPGEAEHMHEYIAHLVGERVPVLYGGSVTPQNVASFLSCAHSAGVLVGSASTKFSGLTGIISRAARISA